MTNEALKTTITELHANAIFDDSGEMLQLQIEVADWKLLAQQLRNDINLHFDFLFSVTCIDWKTHLTMVYHLNATSYYHTIVVKININRADPAVETVSDIWRTAEFHEREVYELFGVNFLHHPDLRLLILPDGWEGKNPLRKDFEDPINMIRL